MDVLTDRWTFLILREAFFGVRRYGQMQRNLGIARNVLADRLSQLVANGMFEKVRYRTDPDWYEYRLTDRAVDLYPVIVGLMRWASQHLAQDSEVIRGNLIAIEVEIVRVHADSSMLVPGEPDRIDPDKWRPLIMSFQHFYGLTPRLQESTLATIPESLYRPVAPAPPSRPETNESELVAMREKRFR